MKKNIILLLVILIGTVGCVVGQETQKEIAVLPEGDFVVMPWSHLHSNRGYDDIRNMDGLEGIAACGFNVAGYVWPEDLPKCKELYLKAFISQTERETWQDWTKLNDAEIDRQARLLVGKTADNPQVVGYFIDDEPRAGDYPALAKAVAAVKRYAPGKIAYINLFPNHASPPTDLLERLQTDSYREYVERLATEVKSQLISYDNYTILRSMDMTIDPPLATSYYTNLAEVRSVALEQGLPFWNVVVCCQIRPWSPIPSPANLMHQAYTSLAAGASGVCWYKYFGDNRFYAPIDNNVGRTTTWRYLQTVNHHLRTLGPIIIKLKSTGLYFSSPAPDASLATLPGEITADVESTFPVMVGEFVDKDQTQYVMVVNISLTGSSLIKLKLKDEAASLSAASPEDGIFRPVDKKAGVWMVAGQGVLFKIEPGNTK